MIDVQNNAPSLLDSRGNPINNGKKKKKRSNSKSRINPLDLEESDFSEGTLMDTDSWLHEKKRGPLMPLINVQKKEISEPVAEDTPKEKVKKSVSFKVGKKGKIKPQIHEVCKFDAEGVWWTPEELQSFRRECVELVGYYQEQKHYVQALNYLYKSSQDAKGYSSKLQNKAFLKMLAYDGARGMECHIHETASCLQDEYMIQMVDIASEPGMTPATLRRASRPITRAAARMARVMARYDEAQVDRDAS